MLSQTSRNRKSFLNALSQGIQGVAGVEIDKRNKAYSEYLQNMEQKRRERILAIQNDNNLSEWDKRIKIQEIESEADKYVADKSQHRSMTHIKVGGDGGGGGGSKSSVGSGTEAQNKVRKDFNDYFNKQRNDYIRREDIDETQAELLGLRDAYGKYKSDMEQVGDTEFLKAVDYVGGMKKPKDTYKPTQLNDYIYLAGMRLNDLQTFVPQFKSDILKEKVFSYVYPTIQIIDSKAKDTYQDINPMFKNLDPNSRRAKIRQDKGKGIITIGDSDYDIIPGDNPTQKQSYQYFLDRMKSKNKE